MIHNIMPGLQSLTTPIELVHNLDNNPHFADIGVHKALLKEFGQHRPVVARGSLEEGGYAIVGNHMLKAARELGWTHIAVVWTDESEEKALARAITDNRAADFGKDDPKMLGEIIPRIQENYVPVFDILGWDDFEIASMQELARPPVVDFSPSSFIEPERRVETRTPTEQPRVDKSTEDIVKTGAGSTDPRRSTVVNFTIVFDDTDQQQAWYSFIKWLRNDPGTDGETTAAKLIDFVTSRADF